MRVCSIEGCERIHYAKSMCNMHWHRVRMKGSTADPVKPTLAERFWSHVQKAEGNACWLWTASTDNHGYGQIQVEYPDGSTRPTKAHRVGFFLEHGRWPEPCGLHRCDTPRCVRHDHVFEGTKQDNTTDMMEKGRHNPVPRRDVCLRGHALSGDNLKIKRLGTRGGVIARSCRECERIQARARRQRKKEARQWTA